MTQFISTARLPTMHGEFGIHVFVHEGQEHLALTQGLVGGQFPDAPVLMRVHSECLTGDGLFSLRCDCGPQLAFAMDQINRRQAGLLIYLRQEGRGIGLVDKIRAYGLQDRGDDTYEANINLGLPADNRSYEMIAPVLAHFGVRRAEIMTNNPDKIAAIAAAGVEITDRIPINPGRNPHNHDYLQTKVEKFNHL